VHGFCCYDNAHVCKLIALYTANAYSAKREMSASACTRSVAGSLIDDDDYDDNKYNDDDIILITSGQSNLT